MGRIRRTIRRLILGRERGIRSRIKGRLGCRGREETPAPLDPVVTEPAPEPVVEDGWHPVCALDELSDGEVAEFIVADVPLAVARVEGEYHVVGNTCPHAGGPLGDGDLEGHEVACPWHGWGFDLTTGVCSLDPNLSVEVYGTDLRDGWLWVRVKA